MAISLIKEFKQKQKISLTPLLKKSIDLLQLSRYELIQKIDREIEVNPFVEKELTDEIEYDENYNDSDFDFNLAAVETLRDSLINQVNDLNLNENEKNEVIRLSKKYKLDYSTIDLKLFRDLKQRINIIPISLALAQAIVESGWGQSRFALEGNALYGQWTTNEQKGIIPEDRDEDKTHAVRKFDNLKQSIQAYMHNINTHRAYYSFRVVRRIAERVQYTDPISAKVKFLAAYAEIGQKYVDKLELIIESNKLREFDRFPY